MCYFHCVGPRIAQKLLDRFGLNFLITCIECHKTYCSLLTTFQQSTKRLIFNMAKITSIIYFSCLFVLKWAVYPSQGLSSKSRQDQPKLLSETRLHVDQCPGLTPTKNSFIVFYGAEKGTATCTVSIHSVAARVIQEWRGLTLL